MIATIVFRLVKLCWLWMCPGNMKECNNGVFQYPLCFLVQVTHSRFITVLRNRQRPDDDSAPMCRPVPLTTLGGQKCRFVFNLPISKCSHVKNLIEYALRLFFSSGVPHNVKLVFFYSGSISDIKKLWFVFIYYIDDFFFLFMIVCSDNNCF